MAAMKGKGSPYNFAEITYRSPESETSKWIPIDHSRTVTVIPNNSWQPNDMPLPTYVTAPKAPNRPVVNKESAVYDQDVEVEIVNVEVDEVFDQEQDKRAANE
jgi:hypothetical protein